MTLVSNESVSNEYSAAGAGADRSAVIVSRRLEKQSKKGVLLCLGKEEVKKRAKN